MIVGVARETFPGERRVALVPAVIAKLKSAGLALHVQAGAGQSAGFSDEQFRSAGAQIIPTRQDLFATSNLIAQIHALGDNPTHYPDDVALLQSGQVVVAQCDPLGSPAPVAELAQRDATLIALELVPRTTRAQSMDVLSSMATLAGYKAVLLAANTLPKMFPMLITAAGTVTPARVLVIGAGVAGLQAIATARRLGAVVTAYDVRPAVKEEVESIGARFLDLSLPATSDDQRGGYAQQLDETFYQRQRDLLAAAVAANDVVITTAAVPGKTAPILISAEMVAHMTPGSVIVDLAAGRGGNCASTRPGETLVVDEVTILGPVNLPSELPSHASQMFARNITNLLLHLARDGALVWNLDDEITRSMLVVRDGQIVHDSVRSLLNKP